MPRNPSIAPVASNNVAPAVGLLWSAVAILGGLVAYRFFHLAAYPISLGGRGADFGVFYGAAQNVLHGVSVYADPGELNTFIYPPTLAVLLVPLAEVRPPDPYVIFLGAACSALAASVGVLSSFTVECRGVVGAVLGMVALGAWPTHLLLRQGQVDSLTLVLMAGALWLVWRQRPHWAALALGVAVSLKVTPGVLILSFAWKRQYRVAVESGCAAAVIVVASALPVGFADLRTYGSPAVSMSRIRVRQHAGGAGGGGQVWPVRTSRVW